VVEQTEAVGHAVRASYMYAGMADVAALTGDESYLRAIDALWENVVTRKLHLTGGIGARGSGEAFGDAYELPNFSAYNETCAAIGNVYWNHRLFLLHADAKYVDVLERTLYNGGLSGVSLSGDRFFYPNPLESRGNHERSPWFGCACCPGNVTRFIPSIPGYAYAHAGDVLYVNLFVEGEATVAMEEGQVRLTQETRYPWDGNIRLTVDPGDERELAVYVRIPGWARNEPLPSDLYRYADRATGDVMLSVNGLSRSAGTVNGYARIRRLWKEGDTIDLHLPMPVRRVHCHEEVEENVGKVALQRGPIVYCVEWPDVADGHVLSLLLPDRARLEVEHREDLLGGVTVLRGTARSLALTPEDVVLSEPVGFLAIPYYAWAHRGKGEMAVWLPRRPSAARPLPAPTLASTATLTTSGGKNPQAIHDQIEAKSSIDHSNPFFHWWPKKGTLEWVQLDFAKHETVSRVEVYWFDDTGRGQCRLPESWRLLYRDGEEWKPVSGPDAFGVEKDRYNVTTFDAIETDGLRLEVQLRETWSAGIHEWKVK